MAQIFEIDAPLQDEEGDNYVATCQDCEGGDFEIVCRQGADSRFTISKLLCRDCETEMHVDDGVLL